LPVEEVETPHCATIESLAQFLNIPTRQTAKAMFYVADDQLLFAVLRGDLAVSEAKLVRALGISKLRFATDDEIRWVGAVPGYASPVGLQRVRVVADESIVAARNLVAGANRAGYHLKNTNVPRDYQPERVVDFAQVRAGDSCWHCGKPLEAGAGFVVVSAQVIADEQQDEFKYLDENGRAAPFGIAHWRLDLHAAFLALLDAHHDDKGILFPPALAPFDVHLVALNADKPEVVQAIARLHDELEARGIAVLCDDRLESAGVKFNDADLIGVPLRVTVGPRTLAQESAEIKLRAEKEARIVRLDQVVSEIRHSPFATRHSQFATRHSPFATRHSPFATRHP
jgi:prolyl-tRNA synthetase